MHISKKIIFSAFIVLLFVACAQEAPKVTESEHVTPTVVEGTAVSDELATATEEPTETSAEQPQLPWVDDFETGELISGQDTYAEIGYITWSDGSAVAIQTLEIGEEDDLALPEQSGSNTVLQLDTDISPGGWAGFSHAFSNETLDVWQTQDWSPYEGISMWLYGNNTGGALFIDVLDNRNDNSSVDDAERWSYEIPDDFDGWQYFEIPFTEFQRKDIGNGAPNDGFTLTDVHGYALGAFGAAEMGVQSNYLDQIMLYGEAGVRPVEISLSEISYRAKEGGLATVTVKLNKPADEIVTVQYTTIEGDAIPGRDFSITNETIVFEPGDMTKSFKINAIDDSLIEGNEQTLIVLHNPTGAILNPQYRAILTVRDSESPDPDLIFDFNQMPPFYTQDGVTLAIVDVAPDSPLALPDQIDYESILAVSSTDDAESTQFYRTFPEGQDWSEKSALSFWFYGTNSGDTVTVELFNNPASTTADLLPDEWQLIWSDEFDDPTGTRPDPGIWRSEIGDGMLNGIPGWGNGEFEYYTTEPKNAATDGDGNLVIAAQEIDPESTNLMCWYGPCKYTSARLITWGSAEFAFGRVEARLKLPYGQGIWPAFWMLGTNLDKVDWPQSGEIDIMENIGSEPATVHGTIHGPGYSGGDGIGADYDLTEGQFSDDFHVFSIEWTPDQIVWLVDSKVFSTLTSADIPSGTEWVYNHPFFIILNLAVGGNWPGAPDESTTFPQTLMVDYVRVYGAPDTSERFEFSFVDDFDGWKQIVIPLDAFTRSAEQPDGALDDGLDLSDVWGYGFRLLSNPETPYYFDKLRLEATH